MMIIQRTVMLAYLYFTHTKASVRAFGFVGVLYRPTEICTIFQTPIDKNI